MSYHGECHYNSVHHLVNKLVYQEFSEMKKSISCIISSVSNKPNLAQVKEVLRALPWTSSTSQVEQALKISGNNVDAAVELLILNPDWHNDDAEDQGSIDHCSGTAANGSNIFKSSRPIPHMSFNSNNNNNVKGDGKDSFNEEPLHKCEQFPNSAPKIKVIRGKERLHNKLSIVDTKLSRKV